MTYPARMVRAVATLMFFGLCAHAQPSPPNLFANPDFESGELGKPPEGWVYTRALKQPGKSAVLTAANPAHGHACVVVINPDPGGGGGILQALDAVSFRGKRIRFSAAVRTEFPQGGGANLGLVVTRGHSGPVDTYAGSPGTPLFTDIMSDRMIRSPNWGRYEIVADVDPEASQIILSCGLRGAGKAWFDDCTLEVLGEAEPVIAAEAPRALSPQGLANVITFTRLLGYVRYFHPSDEAAATDWETFAIAGIRAIESAPNAVALERKLNQLFSPIAPTVRIPRSGESSIKPPLPTGSIRLVIWEHTGIDNGSTPPDYGYRSKRTTRDFAQAADVPSELVAPLVAELGNGLASTVPLALLVENGRTLPQGAALKPRLPRLTKSRFTADDRATRLADVALLWNVIQHSYAYFDVNGTDWPAELTQSLQRAALDADAIAFLDTLRYLIASLHDGHGHVAFSSDNRRFVPAFRAEWIEHRLIVTFTAESVRNSGLRPGDAILALDSRPIAEIAAKTEAQISGATTQWIRHRSAQDIFLGAGNSQAAVEFEPFASPGERRTAGLKRDTTVGPLWKRTGESLREMEPGIYYLDLDRISTDEFVAALPKLEKARGLVFDLRGYPGELDLWEFFPHLTQTPYTNAGWGSLPHIELPDHRKMTFVRGGWTKEPKEPYLAAKRAFITDGRAISSAENWMNLVRHFKLGAIVGGFTAGTNGTINILELPGGYSARWTGEKIVNYDDSRFHGVGVSPTIPCAPTRAGIAAGRDELLERAIAAVKSEHP